VLAFSFWEAFWIVFVAFLWINLILIFFSVIVDLFRDHELSGWAKAAWIVLLVVLPLLGLLIYVIARGPAVARRSADRTAADKESFDTYIRDVAGGGAATELEKASALNDEGKLTDDEYDTLTARILA